MKNYLITLIPVAFLGLQQRSAPEQVTGVGANWETVDEIKPQESQLKAHNLATNILADYHYRKIELNDSVSSVIFDKFISSLDNGKLYFSQSDLKDLEKYRYSFDDFVRQNQVSVPFNIYNLFRQRYKERSAYIQELLASGENFDYSVDESLNTDRESAKWAANTNELNDVWRKYIKSEALDLKLTGKADTAIVSTLQNRYKMRDRALARIRSEQVFQTYYNSFSEIYDPHTNYMSPTTADRFNQDMSQSLEGIGAVLREDNNYIKIVDVVPGGPAYKGKQLKKDDRIIGVAQGDDGKIVDIVGWFVDDAVKLIKGPKGTVVRLQVLPANALAGTPPVELRIVREKVKLEEQRSKKEIVSIKNGNAEKKIGVISIPLFYRDFGGAQSREKEFSSTTRDVKKQIEELKAANVEGIIIDLRNNGGGSLTEAISLTGLFISKGPVVQVKSSTGQTDVESDNDASITYDGPLVVMVNRFSASASEIFAAAIQDYKRGVVVGEKTFGKGTVQQMLDLNQMVPREASQLGSLKITTAKFYRINGSSTQIKGVMPDIELPTAFKPDEYGEASEKSALPWDQIASAAFTPVQNVNDKMVELLKNQYKGRLKSDEELKKLVSNLDAFKKARDNKVVSLQESVRKKEREEAEKKREALNQIGTEAEFDDEEESTAESVASKLKKDVYLMETGRIMSDLITISKEPELAKSKRK